MILEEHYNSENLVKVNEDIKNIIKEYDQKKNNQKKINDNYSNNYNLNKIISEIISKNRNFFDVLVISIGKLSDEDSKLSFKYFQNFSVKKSSQPFILYLTKNEENPNVEEFYQLIDNEFFDKRNLYSFKFPSSNEEKTKVNDFFMKCMNYYHEIGTFKLNMSHSFNILICGPAGVGKSSFINQFLQEKQAKEGEGLSVTHEITKYIHSKYPITIFDTPGFEGDDTVKMVRDTIEEFEKNINESKNHLDLILYYTQLKQRSFFQMEIELIKKLIKENKRIIFIFNSFGKSQKGKETKRLLKIMEDSIKQIFNNMDSKIREKLPQILEDIILVNQNQSTEEDDDGNSKIKQCYGMDVLFKKIYEIFQNQKISIYEIVNSKDIKEMKNKIEKYKLLKNIQNIEDINIGLKIKSSKTILSYAKYDCFIWFGREGRRKDLLKIINSDYNGKNIVDIDGLYHELEQEYKKIDKKKYVNNFFNSIERFKGSFNTDGFSFNSWFYNEYTLIIGALYLKRFDKEYGEYDDKSKNFLRELCTALNEGIDGFNELSKEWTNIYSELKSNKTNRDWVKRFFIVKLNENK